METGSKKDVEIFSTGVWNNIRITQDDLHEMVKSFEETKDGIRPFLKLGHDKNQKLLQKDGLPAAGWVESLRVKGDKLFADFNYIPKKIYDLLEQKAYRKVSSEVLFNVKIGDKVYKKMLGAVALLGADHPGVMNLNDITALYTANEKMTSFESLEVFTNNLECESDSIKKGKKMEKTPLEQKLEGDLEKKDFALKEAKEKLEAAEKAQEEKEKEIEELRKFKLDAEAREAKALLEAEAAKREAFVDSLVSDQLASPSMKPFILELLGEDKKEYSLKIDNKDIKASKQDLLKETLKLFKATASVNFEDNSDGSKKEFSRDDEMKIHKEAEKYAADHKVTYSAALKTILAERKSKK